MAGLLATIALVAAAAALVVPRVLGSGEQTVPAPTGSAEYANGDLPDAALVTIIGDYRLIPAAAEAFARLEAAAGDAGFALQVNSAYRTYEEQVAMARQYGLLSEGGTAAEPGTSEHGWGTAVDLTLDADQLAWFQANAAAFGFQATIPGEPWHWNYVGE